MWNILANVILIVIGALGIVPGGLPEYLKNNWGWYVGEDVSEDCSFGISKDLEKVHGTVKISTALDSLRPLVFGWDSVQITSHNQGHGKLYK